jgi:prepilin-type N-terminal cleavage/methylation domain-containing protein
MWGVGRRAGVACGFGALLRRGGSRVSSRAGFTLIELLVVVVIIGLLAAIAIPKFTNTKEKAYVAAMKSDLRNLATAEEAFFYDSAKYTLSFAQMSGYTPTEGVAITVNEATAKGWSATAVSANTPRKCYVFSGMAVPVGSATLEGNISCT